MVFDQKMNGIVRKNFMVAEHTELIILIENRFRTDLFLCQQKKHLLNII